MKRYQKRIYNYSRLPIKLLCGFTFLLSAADLVLAADTPLLAYKRCVHYQSENFFKEKGAPQADPNLDEKQVESWKLEYAEQIGRHRCRPGYDECRKSWGSKSCAKFLKKYPVHLKTGEEPEPPKEEVSISTSIVPFIVKEMEEPDGNQPETEAVKATPSPSPSPSPKGNAAAIRELVEKQKKLQKK